MLRLPEKRQTDRQTDGQTDRQTEKNKRELYRRAKPRVWKCAPRYVVPKKSFYFFKFYYFRSAPSARSLARSGLARHRVLHGPTLWSQQ